MRADTAIGCDLGGTNLKTVALGRGKILIERHTPLSRHTATDITGLIAAEVRLVARELGSRRRRHGKPATGAPLLGIATPGYLDPRRRQLIHLANLPCLDGYPLARNLERRLRSVIQVPLTLDTDSNAGAYAEYRRGAGKRARRVLYVTIGTGLGVALVAAGEVVRVSRHTVGHAAHIKIADSGPRCTCGGLGCAESLLAARGILWRARNATIPHAARSSPEALYLVARGGSRSARQIFLETGTLLGDLLATLVTFVMPERIVMGGGITGAAAFILPAARKRMKSRLQSTLRGITLHPGSLGVHAGAIGAALLALGMRQKG